MQIVHLSTSLSGGAGIAALRLHLALLNEGVQSKIITKYGNVIDDTHQVIGAPTFVNKVAEKLGFLPNWKKHKAQTLKQKPPGFEIFSLPYGTIDLSKHPWMLQADIIHLHWVSDGFINLETLFQLPKQFVWTLHDMNPFTGGCHHADGCLQFENGCSLCPQLHAKQQHYSSKAFLYKQKVLKSVGGKLQIIAPSIWLLQLSRQSKLFSCFRHTQIYNLIEQQFSYKPLIECRRKLNLPLNETVVLFVANDVNNVRKGIQFIADAANKGNFTFYGIGKPDASLPASIKQVGYLTPEKLQWWYGAANLFVLPSLAENFPNTICEAICCGTPVVAFNTGGIPELIDKSNGALIRDFNAEELINAINYCIKNNQNFNRNQIAFDAIKKLSSNTVLQMHIKLYQSALC